MGNPEENRNRTGKGTGEIPDLKLTARTDRFIWKVWKNERDLSAGA